MKPSRIYKASFFIIVYRYLKTVIIMAKFELYMLDLFDEQKASIEAVVVNENGVELAIELCFYKKEGDSEILHSFYLDKSTAIKFAKTLRTEINKIQE